MKMYLVRSQDICGICRWLSSKFAKSLDMSIQFQDEASSEGLDLRIFVFVVFEDYPIFTSSPNKFSIMVSSSFDMFEYRNMASVHRTLDESMSNICIFAIAK